MHKNGLNRVKPKQLSNAAAGWAPPAHAPALQMLSLLWLVRAALCFMARALHSVRINS